MKFYNHFYLLKYLWVSLSFIFGQEPFLEIRPFSAPSFEQYPARQHVDHQLPTSNIQDGTFLRLDGASFSEDIIYPNCVTGSSCYDGHAGIDFHMPFNTPILAPAGGYVLWADFSPAADPCPGGIDPNGDQGTIIIAHGNDYFSCYLHMNPPLAVSVGETVETGDILGYTGNSGCAIDAHLHFEIRKDSWTFQTDESFAVDPYGWWGDGIDPIHEIHGNKSEWLWVSNNLVDDGDNGFQRFHGPDWIYLDTGYNGDSWSAPAVGNINESRHYAIWVPYLENAGEYEIQIFIPEGVNPTSHANYEIIIQDDNGSNAKTIINVDQTTNPGQFKRIATLDLPQGSNCSIILRDFVSSSPTNENVIFDAIKFISTSADILNESSLPSDFLVYPPFPNPFNPIITISYELFIESNIAISIYHLNGKLVKSFYQNNLSPGKHLFQWNASDIMGQDVPTGLYLCKLESNGVINTQKLILIK